MKTSLALFSLLWCLTGTAHALELSPSEAAGKRLYREGVSASGAEVSARIGLSGTPIPAATVPCAGCHGSDGRGRPEGGVRPPDITWRRLSAPYAQQVRAGRSRPPYSESGFSHAIIEGIDPAGQGLDPAMPRFVMSSQDQSNLLAYLKRLEDDADPGVQPKALRLGTLLPSEGALAPLGDTVAAVLVGALTAINDAGGIHGRRLELEIVDPGPDAASAELALKRLSGEKGVFALISPLAPALDSRLAGLLEQAHLPLVGSVSLLGLQQDSPMIFEPLPGMSGQLQALADYAASHLNLTRQKVMVVYEDSPLERTQAEGLKQHLNEQGWSDVNLRVYVAGGGLAGDVTSDPAQGVFFLGRPDDLRAMAEALQEAGQAPYLFATSAQAPGDVWNLPGVFSRRLFLAYPFVPSDWTAEGKAALASVRERSGLKGQYAVLQVDAWCSVLLVAEALRQIGRNPAREPLIKALEGLHDVKTGLTPLLGFGPGQRLGMSGAHVVTVDLQQQRFELISPYVRVNAAN
ncbi:ABC transporter substrate-binding protein [Pseudomonas sp. NPDC090201]|uniref:ABC transporter substrate-binding protein n=1 Tax=Pseudomonas sp. NPDC090201 TaxID=3364475 RepID=UPI00380DF742